MKSFINKYKRRAKLPHFIASMVMLSSIFFFSSANAADFQTTYGLSVGGGIRTSNSDLTKAALGYLGFQFSVLEWGSSGGNRLALFSPGVNFHHDLKFSASIAPFTIVIPNSISIGLNVFVPLKTEKAGPLGIFIGFPIGQNKK